MNAEDRDYLSLIKARNDPDADKLWLIARLEAEAKESERWRNKRYVWERAESAEAEDRRHQVDIKNLEIWLKQSQDYAESAERRAQEAEVRATKLEGALKLIASRGWVFDAKGSWSKRVHEIAMAALFSQVEPQEAKHGPT